MNGVSQTARRILVIDDAAAIHEDFRKVFQHGRREGKKRTTAERALFGGPKPVSVDASFEVEFASQGQDGYQMVKRARQEGRPFAVAFVDVRMPPGWDGVETTSQIWSEDPDIQVVICTAYSDYSWTEMVEKLGNSDRLVVLKKPFDTIEVLQLASALTEKWRLVRSSRETLADLERKVAERTSELVASGERMQASEAQYRLLFEHNPHPMWVYDLQTLKFLAVNRAAIEHYGYSLAEFLAMDIRNIRPEEDVPALQKDVDQQSHGKSFGTWRHRKQDGSLVDVEVSSDEIVFDGKPARLVLSHDVTERRHAEARIKRLNRVSAVLSRINGLIVRVATREELFRGACDIAVKEGGFVLAWIGLLDGSRTRVRLAASAGTASRLLLDVRALFQDPNGTSLVQTNIEGVIQQKKPFIANDSQNDQVLRLGGTHGDYGVRSMAIFPLIVADEAVGALILAAPDKGFFHHDEVDLLTELTGDVALAVDHLEKRDRLNYLAYYDVLTGLANRTLFLERLAQHIRIAASNEHKVAVALINLERFKNINDTLGRPAGDALLKQVADWLTAATGDASLLARLGADHFAIIFPIVRQEGEVARLLRKMRQECLDHPFGPSDATFRIAFTAGVALSPDDGPDADALVRNAEAALKKAKTRGEPLLFYAQKMTEAVAGALTMENQLRRAVERQEFVLHYQPKLSFRTRKLTGAEALIRWNDPGSGLVPPGHFIPILEETGLIREVGRWALRKAIEDYLRWLDLGLPAVRIAVNVSPRQLREDDFIAEIRQAISVDPRAVDGLELEITESVVMDDVKRSTLTLQAIRDMAIPVAIDDFGTGFSSLNYLARLPIDTLKIDRSFVVEMASGPQGLALVSTIISLAHSLKLKVVAEGVETEEQSRLLRLLSCDEAQGYLFSRPLPAAVFEAEYLKAELT
ncbi:MAG: EAL domain-containing protein [Vicinamibacteria bacterium]